MNVAIQKDMDGIVISVGKEFLRELKKDLPFFSLSGVLVGALILVHHWLKGGRVAPNESWPDQLFADFVAVQAYGLILFGVLITGSMAAFISRVGIPFNIFHDSTEHLKVRLRQLTSSIVAFTIGISIVSFLHFLFTGLVGGGALVLLIILFNLMLVSGLFTSSALLCWLERSSHWVVPLLSIALLGFVLVFFFLIFY
ncbi:hypothetical protein ACJJIG_16145 [Microbulbifer sp. SSSA007]|uniref:hypothetical protein n=1 Tax=Microbulbifer sp. SSSA007 TaxID=3243379 RepID=UPI004039913C